MCDSLLRTNPSLPLQIGVAFQPVEVEKNVFAPLVEAMILKVRVVTAVTGERSPAPYIPDLPATCPHLSP